jgi:nitroreductase
VSLKSLARKTLPGFVIDWLRSIRMKLAYFQDFRYDKRRYKKYSSRMYADPSLLSYEEMEADIFFISHAIEKGLSLENRRTGFGKEKTKSLVSILEKYIERGYPKDSACFKNAVAVLTEYQQFQKENGVNDIEYVEKFLSSVEKSEANFGGTLTISRSQLIEEAKGDFLSISKSRHSIRSFSEKPVELELITKAVELAQSSPSVCNRQSTRVHVLVGKKLIERVLSVQGGATGFDESIDKLIIVTSCLRAFRGPIERNQAFVDGGMYSMNLLFALHYLGLGACTLNWDKSRKQDLKLRSLLGIPDNENVVLMIAVGNLKEEFRIAISLRKPVEDVLTIHK